MAVLDVATTLYRGTRSLETITGISGCSVGNRGPAGMHISEAHRRATSANNSAKLSYAAVVLEYLLTGRVGALEGATTAKTYTELETVGTLGTHDSIIQAMFTPDTVYFGGSELPNQSSHLLTPLVLFALQKHSLMEETKDAFRMCCNDFNTDGCVSLGNLYLFCDAFYYEWKAHFNTTVKAEIFMSQDVVRQAIRTRELQAFEFFDECDITTAEIKIETVPSAAVTASSICSESAFSACKSGNYILDYCWEAEQKPYIPALSKLDKFVPNQTYYSLVNLINMELQTVMERLDEGEYGVRAIQDNYVNAIMVGKPGTGKTTLANALGATFGMPVRVVTADKYTEADQYQGMTKVADGGFRFVPTPFLEAYKNGGIILLEEFNLGDPAVLMGALGQAIEKPFILYEDGYKEVHRHPLCVIISTMNSGTEGARQPNQAFTSRSPDTFVLDDPDEDQFIAILKNNYEEKACKKVYRAYSKIVSYLTSGSVNAKDIALSVTMRHCLAALRQMKCGIPYKTAIRNTMIGAIAIFDLDLANITYDSVVEPLRD